MCPFKIAQRPRHLPDIWLDDYAQYQRFGTTGSISLMCLFLSLIEALGTTTWRILKTALLIVILDETHVVECRAGCPFDNREESIKR